jgi:NAD(P)-dependent dehydrogenase (short-subunit alcohol dehydrogenase family)
LDKTVVYNIELRDAFRDFSYDLNPLHIDPEYSRRTQFGKPVVYGVTGLLHGLAVWAGGRPFRLQKIKIDFKKPLYFGQDYQLAIEESGQNVRLKILRGFGVHLLASWTWDELGELHQHLPPTNWQPVGLAQHFINYSQAATQFVGKKIDYRSNASSDLKVLGLAPGQLPPSQVDALVGASYLVGMELPGQQALFDGLTFEFSESIHSGSPTFHVREVQYDERFSRMQISGDGCGLTKFDISAFVRPEPINESMRQVEKFVPHTERLKNKVAFVSGGSRGFGAVLAKAMALQGARVIVHYKLGRKDADAVCAEIRGCGAEAVVMQGDLSLESDCLRLSANIDRQFGRLDILINNASPPIFSAGFLEMSSSDFFNFTETSTRLAVTTTRYLLPLMKDDAQVINISSQYTKTEQRGFTHYLLAKGALEMWTQALSWEFPNIRFIIIRPQRMKTDSTNLAYDPLSAASPAEVVGKLMKDLDRLQPGTNFYEIDLFDR